MRIKQLIVVLIAGGLLACGGREKQVVTPTGSSSTSSAPSAASAATGSTSSTTTVTVHITGLISIGDGNPSTTGGLASKMIYVLNARTASHLPVVMARNMFQPTSDRTKTPQGGPSSNPIAFVSVELDGDALVLSADGLTSTPLDYKETPLAEGNYCPNAQERTSLYFFPRISKVVPLTDNQDSDGHDKLLDATDLDDDHVHPKLNSSTIAGWLEIPFGSIAANIRNPIVWDFKEKPDSFGSAHRQQIAQEALWVFTITGDTLTLSSQKDPTKPKVMELKSNNNKIDLFLVNATQDGIDSIASGKAGKHQPVDVHFEHFYEYFKPYLKGANPRYSPVVAGVCISPGHFSSLPCDIYHAVDIPKPPQCKGTPATGDVNCGPDGIP